MSGSPHEGLSRRERQIMDVLYARSRATAAEVHAAIPSPPGNSAVRSLLRILVARGLVARCRSGRRHVYSPVVSPGRARLSAARHLLRTYFGGSVEAAIATVLRAADRRGMDRQDYRRLIRMIESAARKEKS